MPRKARRLSCRAWQATTIRSCSKVPERSNCVADRAAKRVRDTLHLGDLATASGQYTSAEQHFVRAHRQILRSFGENSRQMLALLNSRGVLAKYLRHDKSAHCCYQRSLRIARQVLPTDDPEWATLYHNLAGLEHARGHLARAEIYARKSVHLRERALGIRHLALVLDVAALAPILQCRKKFAEAERLYRWARCRIAWKLGPKHPEMATLLGNFAANYHAQGKNRAAKALYDAALAISLQTLGRSHPQTAVIQNNLAKLLLSLGRLQEAERLFTASSVALRHRLSHEHPHVRRVRDNLRRLLKHRTVTVPD